MIWTEIDSLGIAGKSFCGSEAALGLHLLSGVGDAGRISRTVEVVYLAKSKIKDRRIVVTLTTPWGEWRYVEDKT